MSSKDYYQAHKAKAYYRANRERIAARHRAYYRANRERMSAKAKQTTRRPRGYS